MIPALLELQADAPRIVAAMLVLAVVAGVLRLIVRHRRSPRERRARGWRVAILLLAQPVCAVLLYQALFPPMVRGETGTLLVATAGATRASLATGAPAAARVALPEAGRHVGFAGVPDLATALRRHPGTRRLRVVGQGLAPRDQDAARGLAIDFVPAPLPVGLVHLDAPATVATGAVFTVSGRAHGLAGGTVELLDPAGRRVDRAALADDAGFALAASAHAPGVARYALRLRDARRRVVESVDVAVEARDEPPTRLLLLAAAPGPEMKYLRRWAHDAGLQVQSRIETGGGVAIGDAALSGASLARADVLVVDDRTWQALGDARRGSIAAAVRGGMGLLVRLTAAPDAVARRRFAALGFAVSGTGSPAPARLAPASEDEEALRAKLGPGTRDAPRAPDASLPETPVLARRDLAIRARDGTVLARDADGAPLGAWRAEGRGRVGLLAVGDTYRLVLSGRDDLHGALWGAALATVARPLPAPALRIEGDPRPHERLVLCAAGAPIRVVAPDGTASQPLRDPVAGAAGCAAVWPRAAGVHRVEAGGAARIVQVRRFDDAPGLRAQALFDATRRLAAMSGMPTARIDAETPVRRGPRWPWWLAWLAASGALWGFERARAGRRA